MARRFKRRYFKKPSKRKNVSQSIKNGTIVKTRDEFFYDNNGYIKPEYISQPNKFYRTAVVVDSNRFGHLALIKFQSNGKYYVVNKQGRVQWYNPYIKTKDNLGQPIIISDKFRKGSFSHGINKFDIGKMKKKSLKSRSKKINKSNKYFLRELKNR